MATRLGQRPEVNGMCSDLDKEREMKTVVAQERKRDANQSCREGCELRNAGGLGERVILCRPKEG